jgi:DNA-binding NtrC family response regulator
LCRKDSLKPPICQRRFRSLLSPGKITNPERPTGTEILVPAGIPLADAEKTLILAALERNSGDKKTTAEELGISLKTARTTG